MKSALIVYYSYSGNIRSVVEKLQKALNIPAEELQPRNRLPEKRSLITMLHGGKSALSKEKANLSPLALNPENFDILILAWPLWAWTLPPAMREFLEEYPFKNKDVILAVSSSSTKDKRCLSQAREILKENRIISTFSYRDPLKFPEKAEVKTQEMISLIRKLIEG